MGRGAKANWITTRTVQIMTKSISIERVKVKVSTFPGVARVKASILGPSAAVASKEPRKDDKREEHRRKRQGDLLWSGQDHVP